MAPSRWTGPLLLGAAALAVLAGGDPGLLLVVLAGLALTAGAGWLVRRRAGTDAGRGALRGRLPPASAARLWPSAGRRLALYGPVGARLVVDDRGITVVPDPVAGLVAGLGPRLLAWEEVAGARLVAPPDRPGGRAGVDLLLGAGGSGGELVLHVRRPEELVAAVTAVTGRG